MIQRHYVTEDKAPEGCVRVILEDSLKEMTFNCTKEQYFSGLREYVENKKLIQHAFHFLSPDEREFLMTGMTPEEWDEMFSEE